MYKRQWQASTLLREHRGDGHVAALTAVGLHGREANVLQSAAGVVPRHVFEVARDYDDAEWDNVAAVLVGRGLLDRDGNPVSYTHLDVYKRQPLHPC